MGIGTGVFFFVIFAFVKNNRKTGMCPGVYPAFSGQNPQICGIPVFVLFRPLFIVYNESSKIIVPESEDRQ